jgi:predicted ester cyclase
LRTAFPELKFEVKHLVADDHNVAMAYKMTGIHKGRFLGVEPTGHTVIVRGVQIARFYGGQMVERWGALDELGILELLGAMPGRNRMVA